MADGIYVGMSAAAARAAQLDSIADNLANVETPGFKAAHPAFQAFLPKGGTEKVYAAAVATGLDMRPGTIQPTDNPMDVTAADDLYLGVRMASGQLALARSGQIQLGPEGEMMIAGRPLVGRSGEIVTVPPDSAPEIEPNGDVVVDGAVVDTLALFRVQGPLERLGQSFLQAAPGTNVQAVDEGTVRTGELELGNSSPLEATIQMISSQRQFETAMQAIQTYRRLDERAIEVGKLR